jgi:hypothetical protein
MAKEDRLLGCTEGRTVSKNPSKESLYTKRPTTESDGASHVPRRRTKKHKPENSHYDEEPPSTLQREGESLQHPPGNSYPGYNDATSPTDPTKEVGVGQTSDMTNNTTPSEDPTVSQQGDSRQLPEPARDIVTAMEILVRSMKAELS